MTPQNLLIVMSDEHNARMMGCEGHPLAKTPNLDALAARGTRFSDAYTTCPICVPARASFASEHHPAGVSSRRAFSFWVGDVKTEG